MDGTLIDSMGVWTHIDVEYLGERNIPFPEDLHDSISGKCFHDTAIYFKERFNLSESLEEIEAEWHEMSEYKYAHEVDLKPGAREFLDLIKAKGIKLGIATSNSRALTELVLNNRNLSKYFDYVLTGCDTFKSKPDPEVYLTAAKGLGVKPEKCLVFEDIVPGIMAGKNAGMKVCGVDDKYSKDSTDLKKEKADYFIYSYYDILKEETL